MASNDVNILILGICEYGKRHLEDVIKLQTLR